MKARHDSLDSGRRLSSDLQLPNGTLTPAGSLSAASPHFPASTVSYSVPPRSTAGMSNPPRVNINVGLPLSAMQNSTSTSAQQANYRPMYAALPNGTPAQQQHQQAQLMQIVNMLAQPATAATFLQLASNQLAFSNQQPQSQAQSQHQQQSGGLSIAPLNLPGVRPNTPQGNGSMATMSPGMPHMGNVSAPVAGGFYPSMSQPQGSFRPGQPQPQPQLQQQGSGNQLRNVAGFAMQFPPPQPPQTLHAQASLTAAHLHHEPLQLTLNQQPQHQQQQQQHAHTAAQNNQLPHTQQLSAHHQQTQNVGSASKTQTIDLTDGGTPKAPVGTPATPAGHAQTVGGNAQIPPKNHGSLSAIHSQVQHPTLHSTPHALHHATPQPQPHPSLQQTSTHHPQQQAQQQAQQQHPTPLFQPQAHHLTPEQRLAEARRRMDHEGQQKVMLDSQRQLAVHQAAQVHATTGQRQSLERQQAQQQRQHMDQQRLAAQLASAKPPGVATAPASKAPGMLAAASGSKVPGVLPTATGGRTLAAAQAQIAAAAPVQDRKLVPAEAIPRLANNHEVEAKLLEPAIQQLMKDFVEGACSFGCGMVRRRKGRRLDPADLAGYLDRNWHVRVPGFLAQEVRPYKRIRNKGHRERTEAVQKLQQADAPPAQVDTGVAVAQGEKPSALESTDADADRASKRQRLTE